MSPSVGGRAVVAWGKKRYTVGGLERGKQGVFPSLTFALFELDPLICLYLMVRHSLQRQTYFRLLLLSTGKVTCVTFQMERSDDQKYICVCRPDDSD